MPINFNINTPEMFAFYKDNKEEIDMMFNVAPARMVKASGLPEGRNRYYRRTPNVMKSVDDWMIAKGESPLTPNQWEDKELANAAIHEWRTATDGNVSSPATNEDDSLDIGDDFAVPA